MIRDFDLRFAAHSWHDRERPLFPIFLHYLVAEFSSDEALGIIHGICAICGNLRFRGICKVVKLNNSINFNSSDNDAWGEAFVRLIA